jgi:hypothetical protein
MLKIATFRVDVAKEVNSADLRKIPSQSFNWCFPKQTQLLLLVYMPKLVKSIDVLGSIISLGRTFNYHKL